MKSVYPHVHDRDYIIFRACGHETLFVGLKVLATNHKLACVAMFIPVMLTFPAMAHVNAVVMHDPDELSDRAEDLQILEVAYTAGL